MSECMEKTEGEDNLTLIAKAQSGDRGAMERLISQNMGLVKNIARRFIGRNAEYEDLVQIGTIGMLKAAKSFDTSFGTVFSTYAVPLIIGEIRRFLRDDGIIKVSRDVRKKGTAVMRAKEEFIKTHQREPKLSELSELCGMSAEDIVYALDAVCPVYSLQETVGGEEDGTTLENLTPASENEIELMTDKLARPFPSSMREADRSSSSAFIKICPNSRPRKSSELHRSRFPEKRKKSLSFCGMSCKN